MPGGIKSWMTTTWPSSQSCKFQHRRRHRSGGTDIQGHLVKFNYSIFDSLTFSFTAYINDLINNPVPRQKTDAIHAMADLMWKF